jgi:hypothetical protein
MLKHGSVGVEVGVCLGHYSKTLLESGKFTRLWSIDTWDEDFPGLPAGMSGSDTMAAVATRLWRFGLASVILRSQSVLAAATFPDAYFDLVYLDADHVYSAISADMEAWWPKVKSGGVFAGHDYNAEVGEDVICAVDEHCAKYGLLLTVTDCDFVSRVADVDRIIRSWITVKP